MRRPGATRRRLSGKQAALIGGALLLVVYCGGPAAYRQVTAPWSIGQVGRDTLTGPWTGSPRARQGAEYGLWLNLEYRPAPVGGPRRRVRRGGTPSNLEGSAALCTPKGERYEYEVSGEADRDGADPDDSFAPATLTERDRGAFEATCRRIRA